MKKFIITNIILATLFFVTNFVVDIYISNSISKEFVGEFEVFDLSQQAYDFINVGTSHGSVSFDWKTHELNGLNLAKSGQPLIEDLFLLDQHNDYFSENSTIIVPISFHTLCMDQELSAKTQSIYLDSFKLLGMVRTDRVLEYLFDRKDGEYPPDSFNLERFTPNALKPSECSQEVLDASINIIEEIIDNYSNVILVTTPYYLESLSDKNDFQDFYNSVESISNTFGIEYYDYSRDERFNDRKYFYNNTHLNTLGREMFTNIFFQEVLNADN